MPHPVTRLPALAGRMRLPVDCGRLEAAAAAALARPRGVAMALASATSHSPTASSQGAARRRVDSMEARSSRLWRRSRLWRWLHELPRPMPRPKCGDDEVDGDVPPPGPRLQVTEDGLGGVWRQGCGWFSVYAVP